MPLSETLKGKRKWLYLFLAVCLFFVLLPFIVQLSLLYAVSNSGYGKASLKDVDFNLFTGVMVLKQFQLKDQTADLLDVGEASIDYGWLGLLERGYLIEKFTLDSVRLSANLTDEGIWHIIVPLSLFTEPEEVEPEPANKPVILPKIEAQKIQFTDLEIAVNSPGVSGLLIIEEFDLQRLSSWRRDPATLHLKASWNGAPIEANLSAEWVEQLPTMKGEIIGKDLQLVDLQPLLQEYLSSLAGALQFEFAIEGSRNSDGVISLDLDGRAVVEDIGVTYQNYQLGSRQSAWDGDVSLSIGEAFELGRVTGDINVAALKVMDQGNAMELAAFESLAITGLLLDQDQTVSLERISVEKLTSLRPDSEEKSWLSTGTFEVEGIRLTRDKLLDIDHIKIVDGHYQVVLGPEGELLLTSTLTGSPREPAVPEGEAASTLQGKGEGAGLLIRIEELKLTGDSYIEFKDLSVTPPFVKKIDIEQLSLTDLNQSEPDTKTIIKLKARFDEFSRLKVTGWFTPFLPDINASVQGEIDALSLPPFSPYSEKTIGYQIPAGQLDHSFTLTARDHSLDMKNSLQFRHFKLEEVDRDKAAGFADSMGVPLGLGLDLMRDNDGAIRLDVPIKGRLDDPAVKINTIVTKAMGKAITKASIQYLKYAIQPYGSLLVASDFIGKKWSSVTLAPVRFVPGMDNLSAESLDYLNKIAELLSKREKLELAVCGYVSAEDRQVLAETAQKPVGPETKESKTKGAVTPVLEEQLITLAGNRMLYVKRYLVDKGIDGKRLPQCKVTPDTKEIAGVTLSM